MQMILISDADGTHSEYSAPIREGPMTDLTTAHRERLIDPALPEQAPLPESVESGALLTVDGGAAHVEIIRSDLDSFTAVWSADEQHVMRARVQHPEAMAALLSRWETHRRELPEPDDELEDVEAMVTWPSRDIAMVRPLRRAGFAPKTVVALRPAGRPAPEGNPEVTIRGLTDEDVPVATRLWLDLVDNDQHFLDHPPRPRAEELIRESLQTNERRYSWVGEHDGVVVGMLLLSTPEHSAWMQPLIRQDPAAYLGAMMVSPSSRSAGVGAALVSRAHRAADDAGIPAISLHYSASNPLSVPFWHRSGYRPLWTTWTRSLRRTG